MNSLLIALNIVKRVTKSPKTMVAMIFLPLALIFMIVVGMKGLPQAAAKAAVADLDGGAAAVKVAGYIGGSGYKILAADEKNCGGLVKNKKASLAVVIPAGFSEALESGRVKPLDVYFDESDAGSGSFIPQLSLYVSGLGRAYAAAGTIAAAKGGDREKLASEIVKGFEERRDEAEKRQNAGAAATAGAAANPATGFAVTFMMVFIFTTIGIILEDKKKLTLARMFVSPVKEREIILGNVLGSLILGLFQVIPLTAALMAGYGVESPSRLAGLFAILFCFLVAITGIGIGISGLLKRAFNPVTLIAAVIMPTSILGGCFIPESMLPGFINKIGYLVPQKWVMGAIDRLLRGESLEAVALNLVIILLFGLVFATFGLKTLRPLAD